RVVRRLLVAKIAPHGVAADSELFGDAANRSPLAMHGFDVHPGLQCEHPGLRLRGREKGPGSSYIRGRGVASAASRRRPASPASWGGSVFNRRRRVNFQPAMTEPTNNAAERALRRAVLWRKCCFGSQSGRGLRFVERML